MKYITPVEVTPGSASVWVDVDVSSYVGADAGSLSGVLLYLVNNTTVNRTWGVRKNGSSDTGTGQLNASSTVKPFTFVFVGVDSGDVFECYVSDVTNVDVFLIGYVLSGEGSFYTNRIDKSLGSGSTWTDIDLNVNDGAVAACFIIKNTSGSTGYGFGFRKNGSTDSRYTANIGLLEQRGGFMATDGSEIVEHIVENVAVDCWLMGYVKGGLTSFTNAISYASAITGSYQTVDFSANIPAGNNGACCQFYPADGGQYDCAIRKKGETYDRYKTLSRNAYFAVEIDTNRHAEQKIESTQIDLWLWGYTFFAPGQTISGAGGIASAEAVGAGGKLNFRMRPPSIASAEAIGTSRFLLYFSLSGIGSAEVVGAPSVVRVLGLTGIAGEEAFGTPLLSFIVRLTGIPSEEAVGIPSFPNIPQFIVDAGGIASAEAVGSARMVLYLLAQAVASEEAFGTPLFIHHIGLSGIASGEAFGTTTLLPGPVSILLTGIPSAEAIGDLSVRRGLITLYPVGIGSQEAVGTPSFYLIAHISPPSIASGEAFGDTFIFYKITYDDFLDIIEDAETALVNQLVASDVIKPYVVEGFDASFSGDMITVEAGTVYAATGRTQPGETDLLAANTGSSHTEYISVNSAGQVVKTTTTRTVTDVALWDVTVNASGQVTALTDVRDTSVRFMVNAAIPATLTAGGDLIVPGSMIIGDDTEPLSQFHVIEDIFVDSATYGYILKSANGHYWRKTITDAGAIVYTDLGTTLPG